MILWEKHITYFQNSKLLIFNTKIEEGQFWKSKPAWRHYERAENLFSLLPPNPKAFHFNESTS